MKPSRPPAKNRPVWVYVAPISLVVLFLLVFYAVGSSCAVNECKDDKKSDDAEAAAPDHVKRWYTVKKGDNAGAIALDHNITEELLVACNPDVIDFYNLDIGLRLRVDERDLRKARGRCRCTAGADLVENSGTGTTKGTPKGDDPATVIDESDPDAMVDSDGDGIPDGSTEERSTGTTDSTELD